MAISRQGPQGATIVEYLRKHPKMPKLALAKLIVKDHPKLFTSVEACRKQIVNYTRTAPGTGARPDNHNVMAAKYGTARPAGKSGEDAWKGMMPRSDKEDWSPFILAHKAGLRILLLSDIHLPFHDEAALGLAIERGLGLDPNVILVNGDLLDCYEFSAYERDPRKRSVSNEMQAARDFFGMIRNAFPLARIVWKLGNHEERFEKWLMRYAPHLLDIPEFDYFTHLKCAENGVEIVKDKRIIHAGRLHILHGHEYRGAGGVNPARWLYLRTKDNAFAVTFIESPSTLPKPLEARFTGRGQQAA